MWNAVDYNNRFSFSQRCSGLKRRVPEAVEQRDIIGESHLSMCVLLGFHDCFHPFDPAWLSASGVDGNPQRSVVVLLCWL